MDACVDRWAGVCIDTCVDMCIGRCVDMRISHVCTDVRADMFTDMHRHAGADLGLPSPIGVSSMLSLPTPGGISRKPRRGPFPDVNGPPARQGSR